MGKVTCLFNQRPSQRCQCSLLCGRERGGRGFLAPHPSPWLPEPSRKPPPIGIVWKDLGSLLPISSGEHWSSKRPRAEATQTVVNKCWLQGHPISLECSASSFLPSQGAPSPGAVCKKISRRWECTPPKACCVDKFPLALRRLSKTED